MLVVVAGRGSARGREFVLGKTIRASETLETADASCLQPASRACNLPARAYSCAEPIPRSTLELSIAIEAQAAEAAQAALIAFVEGKGLQPTAGEAKTTQVLRRLVAEAAS